MEKPPGLISVPDSNHVPNPDSVPRGCYQPVWRFGRRPDLGNGNSKLIPGAETGPRVMGGMKSPSKADGR